MPVGRNNLLKDNMNFHNGHWSHKKCQLPIARRSRLIEFETKQQSLQGSWSLRSNFIILLNVAFFRNMYTCTLSNPVLCTLMHRFVLSLKSWPKVRFLKIRPKFMCGFIIPASQVRRQIRPKILCLRANFGLVAQRITRLTTDQKIAGSNPAEIETFFTFFSNCFLRAISCSRSSSCCCWSLFFVKSSSFITLSYFCL